MAKTLKNKDASEMALQIYANRNDLAKMVASSLGERIKARGACIVVVSDNASTDAPGFDFPGLKSKDLEAVRRLLILFEGRPVRLDRLNAWRAWANQRMPLLFDLRMSFVSDPGDEHVTAAVPKECKDWFDHPPTQEAVGIEIGTWVDMNSKAPVKDDASLLTTFFGSMGELLTGLEVAARNFGAAVEKGKSEEKRKEYLKAIDTLLAQGGPGGAEDADKSTSIPQLPTGNVTDRIPKLLLRGDTGTGKTLLANYLHRRCGFEARPLHISIPEFLGKEDMLEYKLFGYAAGEFTGGKPKGDHGMLLENVCRVVFLDEIGEANAEIQAKLLTFLDHFQVRPRGWNREPFYCPVMIVAATNRDVLAKTRRGHLAFRNDLLRRFTDVLEIPPLKDRKQDFEFILDCLLQRESMNPMNPTPLITEIGADALKFLREKDFKDGNFRELEDLFRTACRIALREDRHYLVQSDFRPKTEVKCD